MQEPVYVLHVITCHRRVMPRLAELLFKSCVGNNSKNFFKILLSYFTDM